MIEKRLASLLHVFERGLYGRQAGWLWLGPCPRGTFLYTVRLLEETVTKLYHMLISHLAYVYLYVKEIIHGRSTRLVAYDQLNWSYMHALYSCTKNALLCCCASGLVKASSYFVSVCDALRTYKWNRYLWEFLCSFLLPLASYIGGFWWFGYCVLIVPP